MPGDRRIERESEDYEELVRRAVLDERSFQRLIFSGTGKNTSAPWVKVSLRPVEIRDKRHMQFVYSDGVKEIAKNYLGDQVAEQLDEALGWGFPRIHVQTTQGDLHIRITKKGRPLVTRAKPSRRESEPDLAHDHQKRRLLQGPGAKKLLQAVGIADSAGRIRPRMGAKYRQVGEFLRIIEGLLDRSQPLPTTMHVVDCGCGSAYLTFAVHNFLSEERGIDTRVHGIDTNPELIAKVGDLATGLDWEGLTFKRSSIAEFTPAVTPDMVLSLHACDTATDEAIAQGIHWKSRWVLSAPCCQHELHHQLGAPVFRPVLRHGILRERLADILTDAFRALALRIMGYRTEVIQFVSPEHTSKNLMILAERGLRRGDRRFVDEYTQLKRYWNVTPSIEKLLGDELAQYMVSQPSSGADEVECG